MSDVDKYRGIMRENMTTISDFNPRRDRYYLETGDVIMISKGYNLNAFTIPGWLENAVAVNSFLVLKPDNPKVIAPYLAWFLNSKRVQHFFKSISAGTNIPNLSIKALESVEISLPSREYQQDVATIDTYKNTEIILHQMLAEKKEQMVDAMLQKKYDKIKSK
jgi:restriction endonuclease S subunit